MDRCLQEGWVTNNGPYVQDFEAILTSFLRQPTICFSSGYSALVTMLMAADVKGREVILPSFTFPATPCAVIQAGGIPVYADIDPETLTLDYVDASNKITSKTAAIVPVDAYGISAYSDDMWEICRENGILVLSDSAPSFGSIWARSSAPHYDASIYSFHATKQLAVGEGGCLASEDPIFIRRCKKIRNFGLDHDLWVQPGINGKMTEISALLGLENMKGFLDRVEARRTVKHLTDVALKNVRGVTLVKEPKGQYVSWCYNPILVDHDAAVSRDGVVNLLNDRGVQTRGYYKPCHKNGEDLPVTDDIASRVIALPCYESLTGTDISQIGAAFRDILGEKK